MDVKFELEEGEIEDDGEFLQELEEELSLRKRQNDKNSVGAKSKTTPNPKENIKLEDGKGKENSKKTTKKVTVNKDDKSYEMDDYELLLARHQLIQQQLEKVQAEDQVKGQVYQKTRIRGKRRKSKLISKSDSSKSTQNESTTEYVDTKQEPRPESTKETKEEVKQDSPKDVKQGEEDLELSQMRAALLAESSKKKTKEPPDETTLKNEKEIVDLTDDAEVIDLTYDEKLDTSGIKMDTPNNAKKNKKTRNKSKQDSNTQKIQVLGSKTNVKNRALNNTVQPNKPNVTQPNTQNATQPNTQNATQPNTQNATQQNKQTPKSGKKRRRGGKRAKLLAYRAQQKRELAILEQQQAIAFDNYNTVPMDIENDESSDVTDGVAPLPLIETPDIPPPPPPLPPSDLFKPVEDQIELSMTTNTVAWMPGYMERLEPDNSMNSNQAPQNDTKQEIVTGKENENNNNQVVGGDEIDEKEVWALRAQALKSLACKRASKVKMTKKVSPQTRKETITKKNTLLKDTQINDLSPLPSPTSFSIQPIAIPIKVGELISRYKAPVHTPVVIKLRKEDFESSEDEEYLDSAETTRARLHKRRISATDEELITELRAYTEKTQTKVKSHSLLVQKDQLEYKKLNNELGEKKTLFRKQTEQVKALQAKLQAALREKANTRKAYNKLHSMLLDVKSGLKEKISLRKKVQEDLLKSKALVGNDKAIGNSKLSNKVRDHIITLSTNFRRVLVDMSKIQNDQLMSESSQEDEQISESMSSSDNDVKKKLLRRTAASVKNMSKEDLCRLELELREKLKLYQRNNKNSKNQNTNDKLEENLDKKISISNLPSISTQSDLTKLRGTLNKDQPSTATISFSYTGLLEELQKNDTKINHIVFSKELSGQSNVDLKIRPGEKYEEKAATFKYKSPLLRFRSYRLNPYYRTQNKYSIKSPSFTNVINARKTICKFDLLGTCNDEKCSYWHFSDMCELSPEDLIQDLVSYDPSLFDATDTMNSDTKQKLLHSFTQQFMAQYNDKISNEEQLLILWNKMKERRKSRKIPVYECVNFSRREWWKLCRVKSQGNEKKDDNHVRTGAVEPFYYLKNIKKNSKQDNVPHYESQEVRYYSDAYQTTAIMEEALSENPNDVKMWLSLARYHLKDKEANEKESVEKALGVLSKSLEVNRNSEDLWIEYLSLFSKHSSSDELREISYQAVMYSPTYNVWWTCLSLESTHIGKQEICTEMMKFIMDMEEESEESISNALLETLLYLCKLLQDRDRCKLAYDCLAAALGINSVDDNAEKISMDDLRTHLTLNDLSFLWICFLSVKCFHSLPEHIFPTDVCGPGRLVDKKNFILDWNRKTAISENDIRSVLQLAAFESFPDRPISPVKSAIMLYENLAFFEIHTKNFHSAGDILRLLTMEESGFVDGWILLLLLYMKHSPMDAIVKVAEEAIHKCDHDVVLVYIYSNWLYKKGMPSLALDKLTKCIHTYFQVGPDDPEHVVDILYLYRAVLGLEVPFNVVLPVYLPKASSGVKFYYWMCYCLLLKIREVLPASSLFHSAIDEAFESAVHQYVSRDNMKRLWDAYMEHKLEEVEGRMITSRMCNQLVDLLLRSVVAIPSTSTVRENKNVLWKDFTFQNQMVKKCMNCVPESQRSKVYRKLINLMPDNVALAQRICVHEMKMGNLQQVRVICGAILRNYPKFIPLWSMAIQVERKSNSIREARWLFEEAVKSNPCNAKLWREYASFEIAYNTDSGKLDETLNNITERSSTNGIDIREYLRNLSPG